MYIDILFTQKEVVRFTNVMVLENKFHIAAEIVDYFGPIIPYKPTYNHPDAGNISFSGEFDENDNTIDFRIGNVTSLGSAASALSGYWPARIIQDLQWKTVIKNVEEFIRAEEVFERGHFGTDNFFNVINEDF